MVVDFEWSEQARCRGLPRDIFFPEHGAGVLVAQRICNRCPVAAQCLAYALEHRVEHGVWGGHSERSRMRMLRRGGEAVGQGAP